MVTALLIYLAAGTALALGCVWANKESPVWTLAIIVLFWPMCVALAITKERA